MEFDIEKHRVVGRVDHALKPEFISARVKVIGFLDNSNELCLLDDNELVKIFPPKGFIYAYKLLHGSKYEINDIVQLSVTENPDADGHKDNYSWDRSFVKDFGIKAYKVDGFKITNNYTDLSSVKIIGENSNGDFYGITNKYVIGKLKLNNGIIDTLEKSIKIWDKDECFLYENENSVRLLKEPDGEYFLVDCMDDNSLFEWFRGQIKEIDPPLFQKLNTASNWKTKIPALFDKLRIENADIEKLRLKRLESKINHIELTWNEIIEFREQSPTLKKVFNDAITKHIDELQSEYTKKKIEFEHEFNKKKNELFVDFETTERETKAKIAELNSEINKKQTEAQKAAAEYEQAKQRLVEIEKEKSRIISDFGIIKEVLSLSASTSKSNTENTYILDELVTEKNQILNEKDYINNIQYYLADFKIEPKIAKRIFETITIYKVLFVSDIRIALSVINATGNAKFIIQHTEPDWLHFKDFWNNGLSTIWNSAHENSEIPHFFVLEDVNLSSPECYARPLLDVIAGIRGKIPFAETCFPNNLIIFATKASSQNPTIGLRLYEETFPNWGGIGFRNKIKPTVDVVQKFSFVEGKIDSSLFSIETDVDEIKMLVNEEYKYLFDEE